jgi:ATP synthase protein I
MGRNRLTARFDEKVGKQMRDIGSYTLIPSMMLAGPAVGYGLGWLLEKQFGGAPYVSVVGILLGLAAGFQQIILLLRKKTEKK